jgi:hypothetical protein
MNDKTLGCHPNWPQGQGQGQGQGRGRRPTPTRDPVTRGPLDFALFSLRAVAGMTDMFLCNSEWRKMSSLRDFRISGVEPLVSNPSFGAIFEHANQLF